MACGADVARGTRADATWHARPRGIAARAHMTHRWRRRVAGPGKSTRMPRWRHVARESDRAFEWRAHGLVGRG